MKALTLVVLALMLPGSGLSAQWEGGPITRSTRVRVHAPEVAAKPLVGRAVLMDTDSLVLERGRPTDRLVLPMEDVQRLEISRGRNHLMGAVKGAGIGGLAGGVALGGLVALDGDPAWAFLGFIAGAVYAAPLGAVVGAVVGVERWETHAQWRVGLRAPL
ncbi:MAG: hypothetical protein KY464_14270 [Gemmatimonadetes bacterium]|nr:hypothetical protein [Gemmatimonadota bacterium]